MFFLKNIFAIFSLSFFFNYCSKADGFPSSTPDDLIDLVKDLDKADQRFKKPIKDLGDKKLILSNLVQKLSQTTIIKNELKKKVLKELKDSNLKLKSINDLVKTEGITQAQLDQIKTIKEEITKNIAEINNLLKEKRKKERSTEIAHQDQNSGSGLTMAVDRDQNSGSGLTMAVDRGQDSSLDSLVAIDQEIDDEINKINQTGVSISKTLEKAAKENPLINNLLQTNYEGIKSEGKPAKEFSLFGVITSGGKLPIADELEAFDKASLTLEQESNSLNQENLIISIEKLITALDRLTDIIPSAKKAATKVEGLYFFQKSLARGKIKPNITNLENYKNRVKRSIDKIKVVIKDIDKDHPIQSIIEELFKISNEEIGKIENIIRRIFKALE